MVKTITAGTSESVTHALAVRTNTLLEKTKTGRVSEKQQAEVKTLVHELLTHFKLQSLMEAEELALFAAGAHDSSAHRSARADSRTPAVANASPIVSLFPGVVSDPTLRIISNE